MKKIFVMQNKDHLIRWGILCVLLILFVCFFILPAGALTSEADNDGQVMPLAADNAPWTGSGTAGDPYLISTREEFEAIADAVNDGDDLFGVYFLQTGDIDMGGEDDPWPTIGITIDNADHQFRGVFDGGQHNITGLYVERRDDDAGLFGYVGDNGVVRNVTVTDGYSSGIYWVGMIASRNYGLIEYCSIVNCEVYGSQQFIGGIVGDNHGGTIRYCCNIESYIEGNQMAGGIAGRNSGGTVENCYNTGDVYSGNIVRSYVGGIVGENTANGIIDNCYSTGWVEGSLGTGAIAGASGTGSTVKDCYYPEDFEDDGLSGLGVNTGTEDNVTPRSDDDFNSGEVAWELSKGHDGGGWGQNLTADADYDDDGIDHHPHFTDMQDKARDTTPVYRVTFTANTPPNYVYDPNEYKYFVDPGEDVELPPIPDNTKWYANGKEFTGKDIQQDADALAGTRILFGGESDTITVTGTYSTRSQTLDIDLDQYMGYENDASTTGRFEYTITDDIDSLNASLSANGKTLTVPSGTNTNEDGYTLSILAHEKGVLIMPLSMGSYGTEDVTLNVKVIINKATPVITVPPAASDIDYGQSLAESTLSGGRAQHPVTDAKVDGTFEWKENEITPTVNEAALIGYFVTFTPEDTRNYNTVDTMVTLEVIKADPTNIVPPNAKGGIYNGSAQELIEGGSADGGTMKYWLAADAEAETPDPDAEYSSTIPARANAGTYRVWYKVLGDGNHKDTVPEYIDIYISPYPVNIDPGHITYNGSKIFTIPLDMTPGNGITETIVASLTADSSYADTYEYSAIPGSRKYTVELSNSNYITAEPAGTLTIDQLPAVLRWEGLLTFEYHEGQLHTVEAVVKNAVGDDTFDLEYENDGNYVTNNAIEAGGYIARVSGLGNPNYTMTGAQNTEQPWRIFEADDIVTLNMPDGSLTYGDSLELTAEITATSSLQAEDDILTMADAGNTAQGTVTFYANDQKIGESSVFFTGDTGTAAISVDMISVNHFSTGSVPIRAEYSGSNDWEPGMDAKTITIGRKELTASITETTENAAVKTYDGNNAATGLDISLNDGVVWCDENDVYITADGYTYDSANAGNNKIITAQNVTLSGTQSSNYKIVTDVTTGGRIDPKTVRLEWRGVNDLVYTGDPVNVNATATELIPGDECNVTVTGGADTDAGEDHKAKAIELDNGNYTLPEDDTIFQEYIIYPADLYITEQRFDYNGMKEFTASVNGVTPTNGTTEKVTVDLITSSAEAGYYTYSAGDSGDAGDNTYTASIENNTNYKIAGGSILTIVKIDRSGSDDPTTDPNDPNDPADPTDPVDPNDPTDPTDPNDPTDPTDPDDPGGSGKPTEPGDPTVPDKPTVPGNPAGSGSPTSQDGPLNRDRPVSPKDNTDGNGEDDYTEDISSDSAVYAVNEKIRIGASYTGIVIIISVIAALSFILKRKYSGQKTVAKK